MRCRPSSRFRVRGRWFLIVLVGALLSILAVPADASTVFVPCGGLGGGAEGLAHAITAANSTAEAETIELEAGCTYVLTSPFSRDLIAGDSGLPAITRQLTIEGNDATITRLSSAAFRIMRIVAAPVRIYDLAIKNGDAGRNSGGGILSQVGGLAVTAVTLSDNTALSGGGLAGSVVMRRSLIVRNRALSNGGGLAAGSGARVLLEETTVEANSALLGGGVSLSGTAKDLVRSTFTTNSAAEGGGAVWINEGLTNVVNVTFSGNTASKGAGIYNNGTAHVFSSTIAGNSARESQLGMGVGGGILTESRAGGSNDPVVLLDSSIVASNAGGDCVGPTETLFLTESNVSDGSCPGLVGDPHLGPLRDNGGPTATMAALKGSIAIDRVNYTFDDLFGIPVGTDQRGATRQRDGDGDGEVLVDIGAYEAAFYRFVGFAPPISDGFNAVTAGKTIPVKFSLGGNHGIDIFVPPSPTSRNIDCDSTIDAKDGAPAISPQGPGVKYDPTSDSYTFHWRTEPSWANTCRQLIVVLADGTYHRANFFFR